jgi:uncharacterized membrane protein YphA (DoxX/SURF4 family)
VPILIGAVFFVHRGEGLLTATQSLEFSALVLFLLLVFVVSGAGKLSLDYVTFGREIRSEHERDTHHLVTS